MPDPHPLTRWLSRAPTWVFSAWAITGAFMTYFCMYAYRKPFAAGTFDGQVLLPVLPPMDYKVLLIIAQVMGYCVSKFIGIKVISEMGAGRRALAIFGTIGVAWAALGLFAVVPAPWNALCLFVNGMPLGMVWGLVFGYLEGRRVSEALGAGLSASYIIASGFTKSVGVWSLGLGVPERWMPFFVGLLFAAPLVGSVWMLSVLPPPSAEDERLRTRREPMDAAARAAFVRRFLPGIVPLTALYFVLTAYRDFRDNFARELWVALGYEGSAILTASEVPILVGVLAGLAALMGIRDNRKALIAVHALMLGGTLLIGASTALWQAGVLGPAAWMVAVGLGLYLAYVPYGCVLFDRLIAAVGWVGTAGFLMYVTDAFGYLGSVGVLLFKNFGQAQLSWLEFFVAFSYGTAAFCSVCFAASLAYFAGQLTRRRERAPLGAA